MMQNNKLFYGWVNVAVCFLALFFTLGVAVTSFSATSAYIVQEWGISQTAISTLVTYRTLVSLVSVYACGIYYKHLSTRMGLAIGLLMGAAGYVVFALSDGLVGGYIAMTLTGAARSFGGMFSMSLLMDKWFLKNKGFALGVVAISSGFTTMIMPKLLVGWVEGHSLSYAFWVTAALFVVVSALVMLFVKENPADVGQIRMGEGGEGDKKKRIVTEQYNPTMTHCVLLLVACFFMGGFCYTQGQIRTLNLTTAGWTAAEAAASLSTYGTALLVGKFIYGPISDRLSQRKSSILWYGVIAAGHALYACAPFSWFTPGMATAAHLLYSLGGPVCTVGLALYGIEMAYKGDTVKWVRNYLLAYNLGSLLLTPFAGMSADATGNYSLAFFVLAAMALIGGVFATVAHSGAYKRYMELGPAVSEEPVAEEA